MFIAISKRVNNTIHKFLNSTIMANLILASKREVKSGANMWHVYRLSENTKSDEFWFALPIKALKYAFMLRKRTGAIIPRAIYGKLMEAVSADKAQAEPSAPQESAPQAEQVSEPSALAKAFEDMKRKHPDAMLLFRMGDFYISYADDAKVLSEVCGITLTRQNNVQDITAQQAMIPAAALDTYLPMIVRAGKRVAICDEPMKFTESAPKKATRKSAKKESK